MRFSDYETKALVTKLLKPISIKKVTKIEDINKASLNTKVKMLGKVMLTKLE